jgi:hypothetical protein
LNAWLGVDTLSKRNEVAIFVENAKFARTPRLVLQRGVWMNDTLRIELVEQFVDSSHIHAATRVLGDMSFGTGPKVNLNIVAGYNAPSSRLNIYAPEPEPRAIKGYRALDIERSQDGRCTIQGCHCSAMRDLTATPNKTKLRGAPPPALARNKARTGASPRTRG